MKTYHECTIKGLFMKPCYCVKVYDLYMKILYDANKNAFLVVILTLKPKHTRFDGIVFIVLYIAQQPSLV